MRYKLVNTKLNRTSKCIWWTSRGQLIDWR